MYESDSQVFFPVAQPQLIQKTYCIIPTNINKEHNDERNSVAKGKNGVPCTVTGDLRLVLPRLFLRW